VANHRDYPGQCTGQVFQVRPTRFDIAVPTKRMDSEQDKFEFYIGLGQSF